MTRTMLDAMEAHTGKRPIIYTDITFHAEVLEGEFDDYPYWIRSVAAEPHERYNDRRWTFWQFTTTGRVPGIDGDVDRNTFYGTENQWRTFLATDCDPRDAQRSRASGLCRKSREASGERARAAPVSDAGDRFAARHRQSRHPAITLLKPA